MHYNGVSKYLRSIFTKVATHKDVHLNYQSGMLYIIWDAQQKSQNELLRGRPLDEFIKEPHIHSNTWSISSLSRINNELLHFHSKNYAKRIINNQLLQIIDKFTTLYNQKHKIITINCYWKAQMLVKEYVLKTYT